MTVGRPGERIGALPARSGRRAFRLAISNSLELKVLRRPLESAQYTSADYAVLARRLDVRLSVGRTGSCHDNAVAESWFAMLKNEMYYRHRHPSRASARFRVMQYIEVFYNRQRLHSTLGYRTPAAVLASHEPQTATAA